MKRWSLNTNADIENPAIDAFLAEVIEVCKRHGYSIAHEDGHGCFVIENASEPNFKWLMDASDATDKKAES